MRVSPRSVLAGVLFVTAIAGTWSSAAGTGSIAGTVTDATSGSPLSAVYVQIYTCTGRRVTGVRTDTSGAYSTPATLDRGWYLARTSNSLGYVNQLHRGFDCVGECDVVFGTPVWVDSAPARVDFALRPGGRVSGTVRNTLGAAVPGVVVDIYDMFGTYVAGGTTDAKGTYLSGDGLLPGTYHAVTSNDRHLIEELYDDISCPFHRCDPTLGTAISVTLSATTSGVDFALETGGHVKGRVTNSFGAAASGSVNIFDATGQRVASGSLGPTGTYTSDTGLVTGSYFAQTQTYDSSGSIDEVYDRAPCPPVAPTAGRPIRVTVGAATAGVDFALSRGGTIRGSVTDARTGALIDGGYVTIDGPGSTGASISSGSYAVGKLCPGIYTAVAKGPAGMAYVPELYAGLPCSGCSASAGTPIAVTSGATTRGIDFSLDLGARISGVVTDAATSAARKGLYLDLFSPSGGFIRGARVDCHGNGVYLAPADEGLAPGDYFVTCQADPGRPYPYGYRRQLYDNKDCPSCDITTTGDRVAVTGTVTTWGKNFRMVRSRRNGDYERDGKSNLAVYHPDSGTWLVRLSDGTTTTVTLGGTGMQPAPNDYDGDGKTDPAVYEPATGRWRVLRSSTGTVSTVTHDVTGGSAVRGDFDGDGRSDYGVYDGGEGWSIRNSRTGALEAIVFGESGRVPVLADYDGDDKTDLALYDPASGLWSIRWSRNRAIETATFGGPGQAPVTGDFDGDGRTDLATFASATATWRIQYSSDGRVISGAFGAAGDQAVPLDYDGDGKTDLVTYGASAGSWHIVPSSSGVPLTVSFGGAALVPQN